MTRTKRILAILAIPAAIGATAGPAVAAAASSAPAVVASAPQTWYHM